MSRKTNLSLIFAVVSSIAIVALVLVYLKTDEVVMESATVIDKQEETPVFSWRFVDASTNNLDGFPQTHVVLTALYSSNESIDTRIDTVDGGCSQLSDEQYERGVSTTSKVQCYYAGLGFTYQIINTDERYIVQRKMFEEGLPGDTPKEYEWENIAEFKSGATILFNESEDYTERYSALVDRVAVIFEHKNYTEYRLTTNGLVREGDLNTERGFGTDIDATVYVLNWQEPEAEQMYFVRLTNEPFKLYALDSNRNILKGSALTLE